MYQNQKHLILNTFWLALGAVLLVLSIAGVLDSSLFAGMGGALMAVGILRLLRIRKYRTDEAYRRKIDVETGDERNRFLRMKSWAWTGYIVVLVQAIASVIAMLLGHRQVQEILLYSVCLIVAVYWISYMVLSRKY